MTGVKMLSFYLLALVSLCCSQECENEFKVEPGTSPASPLDCNVIGTEVVIGCTISGEGFSIGWFHTEDRALAGQSSETTQITAIPSLYLKRHSTTLTTVSTDLTIDSYNSSYNGYYWCELLEHINPPLGIRSPSQVVHIETPFTLDQLESCGATTIRLDSSGERCAFGIDQEVVTDQVVTGIEFVVPGTESSSTIASRPISTTRTPLTTEIQRTTESSPSPTTSPLTTAPPTPLTTSPPPTTDPPTTSPPPTSSPPIITERTTPTSSPDPSTTPPPSLPTVAASTPDTSTLAEITDIVTTLIELEESTAETDDLLRTILIWTSVGVISFIMLAVATVLCVLVVAFCGN